jgi:8-oxo-dGTP pyrophosphatase MutT (NUDIX family)
MRLLFAIDTKDYDIHGIQFVRHSARSIIINENKVAMVYSMKFDYYKFPGGGIENGESNIEALIRETFEETGLSIIPTSIQEYGYVHRIQKGEKEAVFIQDNYYYLCNVETTVGLQQLDVYEAEENFTLIYIDPKIAINTNRKKDHGPKDQNMLEREAKVLEMMIKDGLLK